MGMCYNPTPSSKWASLIGQSPSVDSQCPGCLGRAVVTSRLPCAIVESPRRHKSVPFVNIASLRSWSIKLPQWKHKLDYYGVVFAHLATGCGIKAKDLSGLYSDRWIPHSRCCENPAQAKATRAKALAGFSQHLECGIHRSESSPSGSFAIKSSASSRQAAMGRPHLWNWSIHGYLVHEWMITNSVTQIPYINGRTQAAAKHIINTLFLVSLGWVSSARSLAALSHGDLVLNRASLEVHSAQQSISSLQFKRASNRACRPGGHYLDHKLGVRSLSQVTTAHLKIGHPHIFIYIAHFFKCVIVSWLRQGTRICLKWLLTIRHVTCWLLWWMLSRYLLVLGNSLTELISKNQLNNIDLTYW